MAIIKVPGHSKHDFLEAKGNHFADISTKKAALQGTNNQTSVIVQRDVSPNEDLEKLARGAQQLASGKEIQNWRSNNSWFYRKRELQFVSNNNLVLPETLKVLLLTTVQP